MTSHAPEWADELARWKARVEGADRAEARALATVVRSVIDKLVAGDLTGIVQDDAPFGPWRPIPPHGWLTMELVDFQRGDFRAGDTLLRAVHVIDGSQPPITLEVRRGRGQPSAARLLYIAEFKRRYQAGEVLPELTQEAEHLEKWVKVTHGELSGATAKTIGNNIAKLDEWKALVAARDASRVKARQARHAPRP